MPTFATIADSFEIDFNKELQKIFNSKLVMDFIVRKLWVDIYQSGKVGSSQIKLKTDLSTDETFHNYDYAWRTIHGGPDFKGKIEKRQKWSNVTLEDTGHLRLSTEVKAFPTFAQITADFEKENGSVYDNFQDLFPSRKEFENTVLTLSPSRYNELIEKYIIDELQKVIIKKITTF